MSFNSLFFLFLFMPVSILFYYICTKRLRDAPLVSMRLVFYAWGSVEYMALLLLSLVFNYITGIQVSKLREQEKTAWARVSMIVAVVANLLLLGFFKYYGFLISNINAITGLKLSSPSLSAPLGLSFYTFTVLSYVLDIYNGKAVALKNPLTYGVYVTFFPKLISGPIVRYQDMEAQLREPKVAPAKMGAGMNLFLVGLFKKVLIADNLATAFSAISAMTTMSVGTAWLGMIFYSLELYFDFSGYSDMAIGLAKIFGFDLEKNFDYPYLSSSISEFWRRWHISLGSWFREYVYIPVGGTRCSRNETIRNLAVVWLLTGLWHGASWNFVMWGIYHGAFVILEKFLIQDRLDSVPKFMRIIGTVLVAFVGWVLFFSSSLVEALHYYGQMLGMGHLGLIDSTCKYYLSGNLLLLLIAAVGCGPLVHRLHQRLTYRLSDSAIYVSAVAYIALLALTVASLVNATYSSFLYFQF